jgi:hypothetical protein
LRFSNSSFVSREIDSKLLQSKPGLVGTSFLSPKILNFFLTSFFSLVFSHHYGVVGAERRKMDSQSIIVDFEIIEHMAQSSFANDLQTAIDNFVTQLIEKQQTGKKLQKMSHCCCTLFHQYVI